METTELNVVTGAFSYTGKYIARRLLATGKRVVTLTGRSNRENPFGSEVSASPFNFDNPSQLTKSLQGATTLYNTYWVRFSHTRLSEWLEENADRVGTRYISDLERHYR